MILDVSVDRLTGEFLVVLVDSDLVVCDGQICNWTVEYAARSSERVQSVNQSVGMEQIYNRLEGKGHGLKGEFRSIVSVDETGTCGRIEWSF